MIVPPSESSPSKGSASLPPQAGTSSGTPPPPPTYQSTQNFSDSEAQFYNHVRPRAPGESAGKRFIKAFIAAVLIWVLLGAFVRSIVEVGYRSGHRYGSGGWEDYLDLPIPSDVTLQKCMKTGHHDSSTGIEYPYYAEASFDLPVSSKTLFLLARGAMSSGTVDITTSPTLTDVAKVDVKVHYYHESAIEHAKVCSIQRKRGEAGVGFFTPRRWWGRIDPTNKIFFEITVSLPASSKSPLRINNFETDLPSHHHNVADLESLVYFKSLSLRSSNSPLNVDSARFQDGKLTTSNAPINVKTLYSDRADIDTSNSMIKGYFNATDHLTLKTSNGPIQVDVDLYNTHKSATSQLQMTSSNNIIDGTVNLYTASSKGGTFSVNGRTSNGRLLIKVPEAPIDSTIRFDGRTSNSLSEVSLPPAYEGSFSLSTSNSVSKVNNQNRDDPSGRGRSRSIIRRTQAKGHLEGEVYWDQENKKRGSAVVRASNGMVTLNV